MIPSNDLTPILRRLACIILGASGLSACDRTEPASVRAPVATTAPDMTSASTSTGVVFDLSPVEKELLSERALNGDPEASFRLAQYYGLAGGDDDPNINDEHDRQQELRWLELASRQGHPSGEFTLAVRLATDDCPRARSMMIEIRDSSDDPGRREAAAGWLDEPQFACR